MSQMRKRLGDGTRPMMQFYKRGFPRDSEAGWERLNREIISLNIEVHRAMMPLWCAVCFRRQNWSEDYQPMV